MIKKVVINNFRSIKDDTVILDESLVVVVGTNGSGKTNLILSLRFISNCVKFGPIRAVQLAGGLDKVFTIKDRRSQRCSFKIHFSLSDYEILNINQDYADPFNEAIYHFELGFEESSKRLIITKESLKIKREVNADYKEIYNRGHGSSISSSTKAISVINKILDDYDDSDYFNKTLLLSFLGRRTYFVRKNSDTMVAGYIYEQLRKISSFNFDPQALRRSSDLLSQDDMGYDGKGFSALMHKIISGKLKALNLSSSFIKDERGELELSQIEELCDDTLPFISKVGVSEAIDDTSVSVEFTEKHQLKGQRTFSPEHLSDGTLKFLACVVAILNPKHRIIVIEEIENYLNPKAIRRLVELMRNISEVHGSKFILTTHSETVLNQSKVKEVLVSNRSSEGDTKYKKFSSMKKIQNALDETGVSLGTLWAKGGLDGFQG